MYCWTWTAAIGLWIGYNQYKLCSCHQLPIRTSIEKYQSISLIKTTFCKLNLVVWHHILSHMLGHIDAGYRFSFCLGKVSAYETRIPEKQCRISKWHVEYISKILAANAMELFWEVKKPDILHSERNICSELRLRFNEQYHRMIFSNYCLQQSLHDTMMIVISYADHTQPPRNSWRSIWEW